MKRILFLAALVSAMLIGFTGCEDESADGVAVYYGTVMDETTDMPYADVDVKVTNGEKIHVATKTADDGTFSVEVRLKEVDNNYYIQIGDSRIGTKKVEFPSFGNGRFDVGIITIQGPTVPTVETAEVSNIKSKMATGGGKVLSSGGFAVTKRGVCWSTTQYPTVANDHTEDGTGMGEFMSNISNLQPSTTYYVRAYAENEKGVAYGNQVSFTTESGIPAVQTKLVRVDGKTMVFCEGDVIDQGDSPVTARGICWGTSTPTISNQKTVDGEGTGGFSTSVTVTNVHSQNLYFRAYATNGSGTAYGEAIMIDHRNPYNLYKVSDIGVSYLVLPYDLEPGFMGYPDLSNNGNTANKSCTDLVAYDYSDWELPTLAVLKLVYKHRNGIGGFTDTKYWTSTKVGESTHYNSSNYYYVNGTKYWYWDYNYVNFYNGETKYNCNILYNVRPVRRY